MMCSSEHLTRFAQATIYPRLTNPESTALYRGLFLATIMSSPALQPGSVIECLVP